MQCLQSQVLRALRPPWSYQHLTFPSTGRLCSATVPSLAPVSFHHVKYLPTEQPFLASKHIFCQLRTLTTLASTSLRGHLMCKGDVRSGRGEKENSGSSLLVSVRQYSSTEDPRKDSKGEEEVYIC